MDQFFTPQDVQRLFHQSIQQNKICHTSLLIGVGASWLTQVAYNLASVILCANAEDGRACGQCPTCKKIQLRVHPDVVLIHALPGKTVISIEQVRDNLIAECRARPWEAQHKIFILQEAELLQSESSNALLKILEEPPDHCILFLTCQNEDSMIPTILSRCQKFRVAPETQDYIHHLQQDYQISSLEAATIWKLSGQNPTTSEELISQWKHRNRLLKACLEREDALKVGDEFVKLCHPKYNEDEDKEEDGESSEDHPKTEIFIHYLCSFWYDVFLMQRMPEASEFVINQDMMAQIQQAAKTCNPARVEHFLGFLLWLPHILNKINPKLFWKNLFVQNYCLFSK